MIFSRFWLRFLGIMGVLGGLILFTGDMLFYYDGSSTNLHLNMANASDLRIIGSAISALLGSWLYMLGLGQVYHALKPATPLVKNVIIISFGAILLSYGVIHGAYVGIATTAKLALQNNLDMVTSTALAVNANQILRLFVYPVFGILSILFVYQVWKKRTLYPRWIIILFPLFSFLLQGAIGNLLSGSVWTIIMGGYLNLLLVIFFTASTIALWNSIPLHKNQ